MNNVLTRNSRGRSSGINVQLEPELYAFLENKGNGEFSMVTCIRTEAGIRPG